MFVGQVLDDGEIVDFDVPHKLLQRKSSLLRQLVEQTGKSETANLVEIARRAFENRNNSRMDEESRAADLAEIIRAISEHDVSKAIDEEGGASEDVCSGSRKEPGYDVSSESRPGIKEDNSNTELSSPEHTTTEADDQSTDDINSESKSKKDIAELSETRDERKDKSDSDKEPLLDGSSHANAARDDVSKGIDKSLGEPKAGHSSSSSSSSDSSDSGDESSEKQELLADARTGAPQ